MSNKLSAMTSGDRILHEYNKAMNTTPEQALYERLRKIELACSEGKNAKELREVLSAVEHIPEDKREMSIHRLKMIIGTLHDYIIILQGNADDE